VSIEKLKQIKKVIQICDAKYVYDYKLQFMREIINTFKDQSDEIAELKSKVETLEKAKTYYLMTENRHRALLNNCVDNDEVILHKGELRNSEIRGTD